MFYQYSAYCECINAEIQTDTTLYNIHKGNKKAIQFNAYLVLL
jgi:hypothetical protein